MTSAWKRRITFIRPCFHFVQILCPPPSSPPKKKKVVAILDLWSLETFNDTESHCINETKKVKGNVTLEIIVSLAPYRVYTEFVGVAANLKETWQLCNVSGAKTKLDDSYDGMHFLVRMETEYSLYCPSVAQSFFARGHKTCISLTHHICGPTHTFMLAQAVQLVCWPYQFVLIGAMRPGWITHGLCTSESWK